MTTMTTGVMGSGYMGSGLHMGYLKTSVTAQKSGAVLLSSDGERATLLKAS